MVEYPLVIILLIIQLFIIYNLLNINYIQNNPYNICVPMFIIILMFTMYYYFNNIIGYIVVYQFIISKFQYFFL